MSWGTKIAVLYIGFVALIITLVVISMNQKVDLVSKDYYSQEVKYQERIDATNNANAGEKQITFRANPEHVVFTYNAALLTKDFSGEIYFLRPSDAEKDLHIKMSPDMDGMQSVEVSQLSHGMYKLQLSWTINGKKYFHEDVVFIK